ncbi:hypothetical protein PsorP6_015587 [Peronosclerospora sorghi]|uniref:Uncharacterized protein n=1 Tax=Peronosclerospora sorghi TaxID=230839 RepID=A0ACC0WRF0_9STRA|nr:hypothetical protein PsorP6_015587 [Peronosclerospora sorghi]
MVLNHQHLIAKLLDRFGQFESNPVRNRFDEHATLDNKSRYRELIDALLYVDNATRPDICMSLSMLSQYLEEPRKPHWNAASRYRDLIGALLCVDNATRPDIRMSLSMLSQYLEEPRKPHWNAVVSVLRYLKVTATLGITFTSDNASIDNYSDANWGGDKASRRSTSGVLVEMTGGPIIFRSKRQATVALASAEAEYVALAVATQEVVWLRYLLREMGVEIDGASVIYMDNKSSISMATNHGYTPRVKHIDLRAHFVRDYVEKGYIELQYVPSEDQLVDFLTKALQTPRLVQLRASCGMCDRTCWGGGG